MDADYLKSEFNDSLGYINRINTLFWLADKSSMEYNADGWLTALFAIFRELSTEMDEVKRNEMFLRISECNNEVQKQNSFKGVGLSPNVVFSLAKLEIDLRLIQNKAGLLVKRAADPSRALSGGG